MWGVGVFRGPGSSVTGFYTRSEQQHGRLPGQEKKEGREAHNGRGGNKEGLQSPRYY